MSGEKRSAACDVACDARTKSTKALGRRLCALLLLTGLVMPPQTIAADDVDMSRVEGLAALPVKEILRDSPVRELSRANYWKTIRDSSTPVVVLFYSNVDGESQRLATLVRYVAVKYTGKFSAYGVAVVDHGKPAKAIATDFARDYSLDKTPGILFYDNDRGRQVLEGEQYIEANFKEFRTPSLLFWKVYYNAVCSYIDKNILD
jgi:thioredoxin family protein